MVASSDTRLDANTDQCEQQRVPVTWLTGLTVALPSQLARAGFVYTPTEQEHDCVTCVYCDYSTVGWEPTDDPW